MEKRDNVKKKLGMLVILLIIIIAIVGMGWSFHEKQIERDRDDSYIEKSESNDVTREEWIVMLTEEYGMTKNQKSEPYFSDVTKDDKYFTNIQSAVEWEILSKNQQKFEGTLCASGRFIALTAMKTIGQERMQMYLGSEEKISDEQYIEVAEQVKLVSKNKMHEGFSKQDAQKVLQKLRKLYYGDFFKTSFQKVTYQKSVVEISDKDISEFDENSALLMVSQKIASQLSDDTIVVFNNSRTGIKVAGKVKKTNASNIYQLQEVKLEDVVASATISDIKDVTLDNMAKYNDWTKQTAQISSIANGHFVSTREVKNNEFIIGVKSEKEENEEGKSTNYLSIYLSSRDESYSYTVPDKVKINTDAEIQASLDIDQIKVYGATNYNKSDAFTYAEVGMQIHSTLSGKVEISQEEKILLGEMDVPLAGGLCSIDMKLFLILKADGSISVEAEFPAQCSICYAKGKGIRRYNSGIEVKEPKIEASCKGEEKLRGEVVLKMFDIPQKGEKLLDKISKIFSTLDQYEIKWSGISIIDMEADVGAEAEAKTVRHPNGQVCADVHIAYPTFEVMLFDDDDANSIMETIIQKLDMDTKWTICSAEDAANQLKMHYEKLPDGKSQYVDKCTYDKNALASYIAKSKFAEKEKIDRPKFVFDYPVERWHVDEVEETDKLENPGPTLFERVVLKSNTGARIEFRRFDSKELGYGGAYWAWKYKVTKVADCKFEPSYGVGTDYDYSKDLGKIMVAKCEVIGFMDGQVDDDFKKVTKDSEDYSYYYAVLPESCEGVREVYTTTGEDDLMDYQDYISFTSFGKENLTEQDKKDIIMILSSFREYDYTVDYTSN